SRLRRSGMRLRKSASAGIFPSNRFTGPGAPSAPGLPPPLRTCTVNGPEPVPLLPPVQGPPAPPAPDFALVLRPLPSEVPATVRVRQLLKVALRRFRFRLLRLEEAPPAQPPSEGGKAPSA